MALRRSPGWHWGGEGVDRIRDILFGSHIEAYEERFQQLEADLKARSEVVRKDLLKRLQSLETLVDKQITQVGRKLEEEAGRRGEMDEQLATDHRALRKQMEVRLAGLGQDLEKEIRQIGQRLEQDTAKLRAEMEAQSESLSAALNKRLDQLQASKVDRSGLATLLTELARSLRPEVEAKPTRRTKR